MDKIVGNVLISLLLLVSAGVCSAKVTLSFHGAQQGVTQKKIAMGTPLILHVESDETLGRIGISGVENFHFRGMEDHSININGVQKSSLYVQLLGKQEGTYTLGPVESLEGGNRVTSNTLTVVVDKPLPPVNVSKKEFSHPVIVRMEFDKSRIMLGEKVTCSLHVFVRNGAVAFESDPQPEFAHSTVIGSVEAEKNIRELNGTPCWCHTLRWQLQPTKAGTFTVPACALEYRIKTEDVVEHVMQMMGARIRQSKNSRVYSNAASVEVIDLPPRRGPLHGLGEFKQFTASMKPMVAREGEGMVLTITAQGTGTLQEPFVLDRMPSALKWYDSKQYQLEGNNGSVSYCYEYIIQGLQPGEWEIPKQTFTYFDTVGKRYKTLETQPLAVKIIAQHKAPIAAPVAPENTAQISGPIKENTELVEQQDVWQWWRAVWYVSLGLISLLVLVFCLPAVYRRARAYAAQRSLLNRQKRAFEHARVAVLLAEKNQQPAQLYSIFMHLFAVRCKLVQSELSENTIEQILQRAGFTHEQCQAWQRFFALCAAPAFAGVHAKRQEELFKQALQWLAIFEAKL